jgi:peptidoglycan L-alanyl-D-glutamate endopeptidase CwlK
MNAPRLTLGGHQEAFARDLVSLLTFAFENGYKARIGEVERTVEQQKLYYTTGRSKTMNSMHLKKCAADIHFIDKDGKLCYPKLLGNYWESLNPLNQWGGNWSRFVDKPHFQRTV